MALTVKTANGTKYLYFQAGKTSIYIGPLDDPARAKTDNVIRALEYSRDRVAHYAGSFDELLGLLPPDVREQYLAKEISRLQDRIARYKKSGSKRQSAARRGAS